MKFIVPQKELATALARCAAIAGAKSSMPILSNVLLVPCACLLKVSATDLEVGYTQPGWYGFSAGHHHADERCLIWPETMCR